MKHLLPDQLRTMARRHPGEVAYRDVDAGTSVTFAEWEEASNRLARGLAKAGIAPGDRVAIYLPPDEALRWVVAYAAVHKAGAVAVPTNTRLAARELGAVLGHAEAAAVLTCDALLPTLEEARPAAPSLRLVVTTSSSPGRAVAWDEVLSPDGSEFQVPVEEDDLADIMYTSGTTGTPKGVAVRHRNVASIPHVEPAWTGGGWLFSSPLFTFSGINFVYNPMKLGMVGLYQPRFDAGRWLEIVERDQPVATFIVPAMAQLLVAHPRFAEADLSSLRMCSIGSAPLPPETLRRLQEKLPEANVSNGYGMTEAGPAYCYMPAEESRRRIGSVGRPMPPTEFRIVDDEGRDLAPREVGEILIRLTGRHREYYRDAEGTARAWAGGWLHSGDLGFLDEDGFLYIVGRKKDVIIRGGNNIFPTDVEAVLLEHPGVREAAVVGVPHEVLGEDVAAFVVPVEGARLDPDELRAFCRERLADYKAPRKVAFVEELPRNATGKVLKHLLVSHPSLTPASAEG